MDKISHENSTTATTPTIYNTLSSSLPPPPPASPPTSKSPTHKMMSDPTTSPNPIQTVNNNNNNNSEHEHRYFGKVKTISTTPASLTIIPDDESASSRLIVALGFSPVQLKRFLRTFATTGELRVSYVLRRGGEPGGGVVMVEEVRSESQVESGKGERKMEVDDWMTEKDKVRKVSSSGHGGQLLSQRDTMTLEEEARQNSRGEFRKRTDGLPNYPGAMRLHEWDAHGNKGGRD